MEAAGWVMPRREQLIGRFAHRWIDRSFDVDSYINRDLWPVTWISHANKTMAKEMVTNLHQSSWNGGSITDRHVFKREKQIKLILYICTHKNGVRSRSDLHVMESPAQYICIFRVGVGSPQQCDKYWVNNFTREKFTLRLTKSYLCMLNYYVHKVVLNLIRMTAQKYCEINNWVKI